MTYAPAQLTFDARDNEDTGLTDVMIHVIGEDASTGVTELRQDDIEGLPAYFEGDDAENYWVVEPNAEQVKADMIAAGFTFLALED